MTDVASLADVADVAPLADPALTTPASGVDGEPSAKPATNGAGSARSPKPKLKLRAKRPPAKKAAAPAVDRPPRTAGRPSNDEVLRRQLDEQLVTVGTFLSLVNEFDGMTVVHGAPRVSDALVKASKQNPRVRKALESLVQTSAWGAVFAALGVVLVPILANHGLAPETFKRLSPYTPDDATGGLPDLGAVAGLADMLTPDEKAQAMAMVGSLFGNGAAPS